jgi:hypothetical protein
MDIQLIAAIATIAAAVIGAVLALGRMALGQFERRMGEKFAALNVSIGEEKAQVKDLKTQVETLANSLPMEYVRREDWIRFSTVIDAKLDRLGERMSEQRADIARMARGS